MNLHNVVRGTINSINPDQQVVIMKYVGTEHVRGGIEAPRYRYIMTTAQVQPVNSNELKEENNYYTSSTYRDFYLHGNFSGLNAREQEGGDKIIWDNKTFYIVGNTEPWNTVGWTKVRGAQESSEVDDGSEIMSELATKQFVLDEVSRISALEIPKKISYFENDVGYITEAGEEVATDHISKDYFDKEIVNNVLLREYLDKRFAEITVTPPANTADSVTYINGEIRNVEEALNELMYKKPSITSFTGGGTYEIGTAITQVLLSWSLNKKVTGLSLNNNIGEVPVDSTSYKHIANITKDTTFTLTADDGKNKASASTSVAFRYKRYWGVSAKESLTNAEILALSSELSTGRTQSRKFNCAGGKYFYFVIPAGWCNGISFKVGGLAFSGMIEKNISFVNAKGYTSSYNVYRVSGLQTGSSISVEVL